MDSLLLVTLMPSCPAAAGSASGCLDALDVFSSGIFSMQGIAASGRACQTQHTLLTTADVNLACNRRFPDKFNLCYHLCNGLRSETAEDA